jgi:Flp pilus assembly protein TadG
VAVEAALLLPFLTLLFVGVIDFSRAFFYSLTLSACARNGAMYASDPQSASESPYRNVDEAARADGATLDLPLDVSSTSGLGSDGRPYVEVTVSCTFTPLIGYPGAGSALNLARTSRMRQIPTVPDP